MELGKNNCGRGVGGSMIHYAGFTPRFHPSDFEVASRDGVAADWPISYQELKPHYERLERELPVAGEWWPWGDPHGYPHGPHLIGAGALRAWEGAKRLGIQMRVGPVGIANGSFGHRPHCIYRGYCLQGCKVERQGIPARDPHPRRARARCRDPRRMHGHPYRDRRDRTRHRRHLPPRRPRILPGRRGGDRRRLLDRDTEAAAELHQQALPEWPGQQQRPRRPRRHGPGRPPGRRTLSRRDAHVQGATTGDQLRALLRDRPRPRVRARLLDPDRRTTADRLGRARPR